MSFAAPLWLLTLALVPAGVAAYVLARRRTRRYAMRFPAVATVREVVASTPSWERHVPRSVELGVVYVF
jgi:Ca-activated chloride channel family protein